MSQSTNVYSKWVACWGNATSISDREICTYSKNLTLRYPVKICFNGNKIRLHLSNLTGTEDVIISEVFVAVSNRGQYKPVQVFLDGNPEIKIPCGKEIITDEVLVELNRGDFLDVSLYLKDFTQMNSGTKVTGPLSKALFGYGNFTKEKKFPRDLCKSTTWFYFLNTIDIFTEEKNHALICYGDSITAQSWPDYLIERTFEKGFENVSIIRRAVCGTRILREYNCINYQAYGLKGEKRFAVEANVSGAEAVIIHHGINDIIHPVGVEVNEFRPMSDMPEAKDLGDGVKKIYIEHARSLGLKVYGATLLPIFGWRTYAEFREKVRNEFNDWIRNTDDFDGVIDFDKTVRDKNDIRKFREGFDSGDHLHPSEAAYKEMAYSIDENLLK